jgi:hypothetical protein
MGIVADKSLEVPLNPSSAVRGIFLADFGSEFVECSGTGGFFHRG